MLQETDDDDAIDAPGVLVQCAELQLLDLTANKRHVLSCTACGRTNTVCCRPDLQMLLDEAPVHSLQHVVLASTAIQCTSAFGSQLLTANLSNCTNLCSIATLSECISLVELDLSFCSAVESVEALSTVGTLRKLSLGSSGMTGNLWPLRACSQLRELDLSRLPLPDVYALAGIQTLQVPAAVVLIAGIGWCCC